MKHYYLINLLALILLLVTPFSFAMSRLADGEVVVTLRDDQPCFSFPLDEVRENRHFFLYDVDVSFNKGYVASDSSIESWTLKMKQGKENPVSRADTPEYCIEYGKSVPFGNSSVARPIEINVPYKVFLRIYTLEEPLNSESDRTYYRRFCVLSDGANKKIIVSVGYNSSTGKLECKP